MLLERRSNDKSLEQYLGTIPQVLLLFNTVVHPLVGDILQNVYLENSSGLWAYTVATYCPTSRPSQFTQKNIVKQVDKQRCSGCCVEPNLLARA